MALLSVLFVTTLFVVYSISMVTPLVDVLTATTLTVLLVYLQLRLTGSKGWAQFFYSDIIKKMD